MPPKKKNSTKSNKSSNEIMKWIGPSYKEDRANKYYKEVRICNGSETFDVKKGETVLFFSNNETPYIGIVENLFENKSTNTKHVKALWFFRAADVKEAMSSALNDITPQHNEIFISSTYDINGIHTILRPCVVVFVSTETDWPITQRTVKDTYCCRYKFVSKRGLVPLTSSEIISFSSSVGMPIKDEVECVNSKCDNEKPEDGTDLPSPSDILQVFSKDDLWLKITASTFGLDDWNALSKETVDKFNNFYDGLTITQREELCKAFEFDIDTMRLCHVAQSSDADNQISRSYDIVNNEEEVTNTPEVDVVNSVVEENILTLTIEPFDDESSRSSPTPSSLSSPIVASPCSCIDSTIESPKRGSSFHELTISADQGAKDAKCFMQSPVHAEHGANQPHSRIGVDYQADLCLDSNSVPSEDIKIWPPIDINVNIDANLFINTFLRNIFVSRGIVALDGSFWYFRGNTREYLMEQLQILNFDTELMLSKSQELEHEIVRLWTKEEQKQLTTAFLKYEEDLRSILSSVPSKSREDIVDYFFRFKLPTLHLESHSLAPAPVTNAKRRSSSFKFKNYRSDYVIENKIRKMDSSQDVSSGRQSSMDMNELSDKQSESAFNFLINIKKKLGDRSFADFLNALICFNDNIITPSELIIRIRLICSYDHLEKSKDNENHEISWDIFYDFCSFLPEFVKTSCHLSPHSKSEIASC